MGDLFVMFLPMVLAIKHPVFGASVDIVASSSAHGMLATLVSLLRTLRRLASTPLWSTIPVVFSIEIILESVVIKDRFNRSYCARGDGC